MTTVSVFSQEDNVVVPQLGGLCIFLSYKTIQLTKFIVMLSQDNNT